MDNQINLKQTTCPNCGAELCFDPATLMMSCNFCSSTFEIDNEVDTIVKKPDDIIPFSVPKKDINVIAMHWLSEGSFTPIDILDNVHISSLEGYYFPMFLYKGRYKGNWSAVVGQDSVITYSDWDPRRREMVQQVRTSTTWTSNSGHLDDNYAVMSFAGNNDDVTAEIQGYLSNIDYHEKFPEKFDAKYALGFKLLDFKQDARTVWEKNGKQLATSAARKNVISRINGNHYKDLNMDVSMRGEEQSKIYIPFWVAHFKYKDENYCLCIDGSNKQRIYGTRPVDETLKNQPKAIRQNAYISLAVCIVSFFIFSALKQGSIVYSLMAFVFVITLIATIVLFKRAKNETIVADSRFRDKRNTILSQKLKTGAVLKGLQ